MPAKLEPFPFIVGNARSGTTLLRAMFDSHPSMAIPWESYFIVRMHHRRARYERSESFDAQAFIDDLYETDFMYWRMDRSHLLAMFAEIDIESYADAVRLIFSAHAALHGKVRYGDKTPEYVLHLELIADLLPEARFIHIIRDGRNVALSLLDVSWGPDRIEDCALGWSASVYAARSAGQIIGDDRYCEVRYEELVANPGEQLRRLCAFAELEFDPHMLDYPLRAAGIIAPDPNSQYHTNIYSPPIVGVRDWRRDMLQGDRDTFEAIAGRMLNELGYLC